MVGACARFLPLLLLWIKWHHKADEFFLSADPKKIKDALILNSGLSRKLQTVMGDFIQMEGYFMKEMLLKVFYTFDPQIIFQLHLDKISFVILLHFYPFVKQNSFFNIETSSML